MSREERKVQHLDLVLGQVQSQEDSDFEAIALVHRSLPELNRGAVSLHTVVGDCSLDSPIFINAMTGGAKAVLSVNRDLAVVARETGVAMAVGSQQAALDNLELVESYQVVRDINPSGVVIANVSANSTPDAALRAVEMVQADMLQLHVNVPQELVMPEGDGEFSGVLEKIQFICERVPVPVIVKEVGFGMCAETYTQLAQTDIVGVDVSGRGGTNFIAIENQRRAAQDYSYLSDWGQSTVVSLLEAQPWMKQWSVMSSGGIRNPLDMIKSFALGARAVGVASRVLRRVRTDGIEGAVAEIAQWHEHLRSIMTMLGTGTIDALSKCPVVITGKPREWCDARGIDLRPFAHWR